MECQRNNQPHTNHRLHSQFYTLLLRVVLAVLLIKLFKHFIHRMWQLRTITKPAEAFYQRTYNKSAEKDRHADRRHADQKIDELPACAFRDDQVLRFADHRHHATQRGTDTGVHHQAA
ncbi:hypothetical protein SRABI106_01369 [Rahnella aquatilis]|nr:hypothetical protein SRABI106_01369 [Rahnella aquatilis]